MAEVLRQAAELGAAAEAKGFFLEETIDHYAGHAADLEAILDAAGAAGEPAEDLATQKVRDAG